MKNLRIYRLFFPMAMLTIVFLIVRIHFSRVETADPELQPVTVQLKWFHQYQFAGYYAAVEQGYYHDAGLEVTLVEGDPILIPNTFEEVLSGRADFGVANSDLLIQRVQGKPVVLLASIFQHSPVSIAIHSELNVTTPHQLEGLSLVMPDNYRVAEIEAALLNEGVDLDQIERLLPRSYPDYLFTENVSGFTLYQTNEPFLLDQANIDVTYIEPRRYGIDFYGDVLYTSETVIANNPELVDQFLAASLRGWEYALNHPDEIITLIKEEYGTEKSQEYLLFEAEKSKELILPDLVAIGHTNPGRWQHIAETYARLGIIPADFDLDGFIYNPAQQNLNTQLRRLMIGGGGVLALLLMMGLVLTTFNKQLQTKVDQQTRKLTRKNRALENEIAEREAAETALRASENRFHAVWEMAADAMVLSDRDGIVIAANPAYLKLYRLRSEQVIDQSFAVIFPVEARTEAEAQYKMVFNSANSKAEPYETVVERGDGTKAVVDSRINFIEQDGERIAMLSIIRDITKQRQLEAQIRQAHKLEALGTFAGGIAHDFNNILTPITLYSELAMMSAAADSPLRKQLQSIHKASSKGTDLVRQILAFSRQQDEEKKAISLGDLVRETVRLLQSMLPATISLELEIQPIGGLVLGNPSHIHQIVMNLGTNGYQAIGEEPGEIKIILEPIIIKASHDSGTSLSPGLYARLIVSDNGPGIEPAHMAKLFDPFFSTKGIEGTGLGLSVVHGIVEQMKGSIAVESESGQGSTFTVFLPVMQKLPAPAPVTPSEDVVQSGHILIIDDEKQITAALKAMLENMGYTATAVHDSTTVLPRFGNRLDTFDLVLVDQIMPGLRGDQLLIELQQRRPDLPVVIMSGYSEKVSRTNATSLGAAAFLQKPISRARLEETLADILA